MHRERLLQEQHAAAAATTTVPGKRTEQHQSRRADCEEREAREKDRRERSQQRQEREKEVEGANGMSINHKGSSGMARRDGFLPTYSHVFTMAWHGGGSGVGKTQGESEQRQGRDARVSERRAGR